MLGRLLVTAGLMFFSALRLAAEAKLKPELEECIFETAPFRECHASTIVEVPNGSLLTAWFGGQEEGDKSVAIWLSRKPPGGAWSPPEKVASYSQVPCWNPVLFRDAKNVVWLFFKVGPNEESWVGAYRTSKDGGESWSEVTYLPGPARSHPQPTHPAVQWRHPGGVFKEAGMGRGDRHPQPYWSWAAWTELSKDGGKTWTIHGPITFPGSELRGHSAHPLGKQARAHQNAPAFHRIDRSHL